jgi:hypothetical protein
MAVMIIILIVIIIIPIVWIRIPMLLVAIFNFHHAEHQLFGFLVSPIR